MFVAKGRDGTTDIWGVIVRPTNFDPAKKYPVIENIYAGPHGSFVPKSFSAYSRHAGAGRARLHRRADRRHGHVEPLEGVPRRARGRTSATPASPIASSGTRRSPRSIRGTTSRASASTAARRADRTRWARCSSIPSSTRSAVSYAGCHDNRMDKIWWNEQWMGWPIGPQYAASSNVDNAAQAAGQAAADRRRARHQRRSGVDDAGRQRADQGEQEFRSAGRARRGSQRRPRHDPTAPYGERKRFDFFVRHLLGVTPPAWNRTATTSEAPSRTVKAWCLRRS